MITLNTTLTPEQSTWLTQRWEPLRFESAGLNVTVLPDGMMQITLPAALEAALIASAPEWVEGDRLANL